MKSIYLETTIPSYATAKPSRDVIKSARQAITLLFLETAGKIYDLYISDYVVDECAKGDREAAQKRLDSLRGIKILSATTKTEELALIYRRILNIPDRARVDSYHIAVCVEAELDYLVSWNYSHLGVVSYAKLLGYNQLHGLKTPVLVTPEALNEEEP
jgi:predicted nucleic acid-binding protein